MSLERLKKRAFENEAVKTEYDALETEFNLIHELIRMREQAGLTQDEVAERMHTKKSNISRLERGGIVNSKIDTLQRYAAACGCKLELSFQQLPHAG